MEKYTLYKPNDNIHTFLAHNAPLRLHYCVLFRVVAKDLNYGQFLVILISLV